jgi:hypothetical protein
MMYHTSKRNLETMQGRQLDRGISEFAKRGEGGEETDGLQLPIRYKYGRLVKQLASTNISSNSVQTSQGSYVEAADETDFYSKACDLEIKLGNRVLNRTRPYHSDTVPLTTSTCR